jgi:hypothetical protein
MRYLGDHSPRSIMMIDGRPTAQCVNGLSPPIECLGAGMYTCPCGYAEGLTKPHYPVPAIVYDHLLDTTSFMYWVFRGWLFAKYRAKPCQT